jgi:hypothetical protein
VKRSWNQEKCTLPWPWGYRLVELWDSDQTTVHTWNKAEYQSLTRDHVHMQVISDCDKSRVDLTTIFTYNAIVMTCRNWANGVHGVKILISLI